MYQQQNTLTGAQKTELGMRIAKLRELMVRLRDGLHLEPDRPSTAQLIVGQATVLWKCWRNLTALHCMATAQSLRTWPPISIHSAKV
jgi:hypothetical protein